MAHIEKQGEPVTDISWLTQHRLERLEKLDFQWNFMFSARINLQVECLWRLLEAGRIIVTSDDHGQKFGLPAPVDSSLEVNRRIAGVGIVSARIREGSLDISIGFANDHTLEVMPVSSGYEAWQLGGNNLLLIAVGGGRLDVFIRNGPTN